jgi:hypothetical protein
MKHVTWSAAWLRSAALGAALVAACTPGCKRARAPEKEPAGTGGQHAKSSVLRTQMEAVPVEPAPPPPDASMVCYLRARNELNIQDPTAFNLCRGAPTSGPTDCFQAGRTQTRLVDAQLIILCRCASSAAPVDCYNKGVGDSFLIDDQLITLCNATNTQQLRVDCSPRY